MADRPTVEVRAGLVMYGGSSLAVYMGGVALEFLHAVQSSRREYLNLPAPDTSLPYHELLKAMGVEFVVDVISGTSAGGLNGVFLARALATGGSLEHMGGLWREIGDFANLTDWGNEKAPKSLLNGAYFEQKLKAALAEVKGARPLVPVLDLHVTTTDLYGRYWQREDFLGHTVVGRQHTKYFQFKLRRPAAELGEAYAFAGSPEPVNQFGDQDPEKDAACIETLTRVARTSAAFPAMFQPMAWKPGDVYGHEPDQTADQRAQVWLSDGGILDNEPFAPALKTIYERATASPVERLLFYVEPDPADVAGPTALPQNNEPSALRVAWAALTLPMYQGIQQHLQSIEEHKRVTTNIQQLVAKVCDRLAKSPELFEPTVQQGPLGDAYSALRCDQLAAHMRAALTESYQRYRAKHPDLPDAKVALQWLPPSESPEGEAYWGEAVAANADPTYLRRKLHFVIEQSMRLQRKAEDPTKHVELETRLWELLQIVRQAEWDWWNGEAITELFAATTTDDRRRALLRQGLVHIYESYQNALEISPRKEIPLRTKGQLKERLKECGLIKHWGFFDAFDVVLFPLGIGSSFGERDLVEWIRVSPYDATTLLKKDPSYQSGAEPTPEEIRAYGRRKMAGDALGHFGGFLSARWRANDFMWGRLDAADQIVSSLMKAAERRHGGTVPAAIQAAADEALLQAYRQILADELDDEGLEQLAAYTADSLLPQPAAQMAPIPLVAVQATPPRFLAASRAMAEAAAASDLASNAPAPLAQLWQLLGAAIWQWLWNLTHRPRRVAARLPIAPDQPHTRAGRRKWLQRLIRERATWDELWDYLHYDHRGGGESALSLHPAVLANTAVDLAQNAGLVIGQSTGNLKVPGLVSRVGRWLVAFFVRFRTLVKFFLPRPAPGTDDRITAWPNWVPQVALILVIAFFPLVQWLFRLCEQVIRTAPAVQAATWWQMGGVGAALLGLLALLRLLFPRGLARAVRRVLPLAGVTTLLFVLVVGGLCESKTLLGWTAGITLWGVRLDQALNSIRLNIPFALFCFAVYDVLLILARLLTRSAGVLPSDHRLPAR
ncbi:MAG: patatin-like protein [Mycobacterium leprae]